MSIELKDHGALIWFRLPEDRDEYKITMNAMGWALVAWDIDQKLRAWMKYGHEFKTADEAIEAAREELHTFLEDHGVSLGDIT